MTNKEDIRNLASIIFDIDKLMICNLCYVSKANLRISQVRSAFFSSYVRTARGEDINSFRDVEKKADKKGQSFFRRIFEFISKKDVTNQAEEPLKPHGVRYILDLIADWYPSATVKFVKDHQL